MEPDPETTPLPSPIYSTISTTKGAHSSLPISQFATAATPPGPFDLNRSTGELIINTPLDRDPPNGRPFYRLFAYALDTASGRRLATADIHILVRDINDNRPEFTQSLYSANVTEDASKGTEIVRIEAKDVDEGVNGAIRYSLLENHYDNRGEALFEINEESGIVKLAKCCLDREQRSNYSLLVEAADGPGLKVCLQILPFVSTILSNVSIRLLRWFSYLFFSYLSFAFTSS